MMKKLSSLYWLYFKKMWRDPRFYVVPLSMVVIASTIMKGFVFGIFLVFSLPLVMKWYQLTVHQGGGNDTKEETGIFVLAVF
ncbi:hypothetical protein L6279_02015 [Candidatus Parcubacteria bacterium]|nr:hypothetical protein [Patescibacteria group bacterium]MCG2692865.1 hypothetical protein [Candidatus Parcubacteria bacterium]